MKRLLSAALMILCAVATGRAQYSGAGGTGLQVAHPLIDRSLLDQLLHAKRAELLFRTDDVLSVQAYDVKRVQLPAASCRGRNNPGPLDR